jgi:hypothetical protein
VRRFDPPMPEYFGDSAMHGQSVGKPASMSHQAHSKAGVQQQV